MELAQLLQLVVERSASDLHLVVGLPPALRVDGSLVPIPNEQVLTPESVEVLIKGFLKAEQIERVLVNKEIDLGISFSKDARFRVNVYHTKGNMAAALRRIPLEIPTIEGLSLPPVLREFAKLRQGLILVTGPTGHGKSTTIATIIDEINKTRQAHVLTIEDPVEFIFTPIKAMFSQREMREDSLSWDIALRSALREDPDVVLIGEMRDYETMASAITIAETGHLVLATLHTNSAAQTVDRVVDVFPENQQSQIRLQLSNVLEGVFSQRLIPLITGGRIAAYEILIGTNAVRSTIRDGNTHQIDNIIQTSAEFGMTTLESVLASYVNQGLVQFETALGYSTRPEELERIVKGNK